MDKYIEIRDKGTSKYPKRIDQGFTQILRRPQQLRKVSDHHDLHRRPQTHNPNLTNPTNPQDYITDKQPSATTATTFSLQLQQLRKLVSECPHCRSRLPQFITKKPKYQITKINDIAVQTTAADTTTDTFSLSNLHLFKMLEQKIEEISRYALHTAKQLEESQQMVQQRDEELEQMEERLTGIFYKISEDIFMFERVYHECKKLKSLLMYGRENEVPAYLKCLALDETIHPNYHG